MKKFTFLLSLLGLSASSAFAGVFVPSTDGDAHVYAIKNASQTQYYCSVKGNNIGSTTNKSSVAYFKIVESETTDQYYVLCLNNNKYVTYSEAKTGYNKVSFTDSKENAKLWKIKQESGQTERYDIFPSTVSGTDDDPSWNWVGGADYNSNLSLWEAKDGSSSWTFEECRQNLTLNYTWNGTDVVKTETVVAALPGADKGIAPATGIDYTNVGSMSPATIDASTTEYTITIGEDLPFTKSTSFDDATWYVMDVHGNHNELPSGKQYVWTYNTDNNIKFPRTDLRTTIYTDNMLWCFMGDVQHGFKIYNKAAGESLTLRKPQNGSCVSSMSAESDRNVFKLYHSQQYGLTENGFCFKIDGDSYYLNAPGSNDNKTLDGYDKPDGGSTSRVFTPASSPTNYANIWLNAPEGAITGKEAYLNSENIAALRNALNTVNENASLENINKLTTLNNAIQNTTATFKEGYYRLVNRQYNKFLHVNNNNMNAQAGKDKAVGSVVYVKSAGEGQYNLMMEGLYLGAVSKGTKISLGDKASKGTYTIEFSANNPIVKIHESTNSKTENNFHYIHIDGSSNAVGWEAGEGNVPSHWYVYPATDIEVALNNAGKKSYATAYLPFGVSKVEGAEAYVGRLNSEKKALDMTEVKGVPAEKGFVLVGTGDKATLTIGDASEVDTDLTGTNTAISLTDENRANYLVFGKNKADNTKVGFFKTTATTIPANKAFLDATTLTGVAGAIAMNFGGNTTGVNTVVLGENGVNAPVFDLSGRRVVAPVKGGVYIQNGKKFIK